MHIILTVLCLAYSQFALSQTSLEQFGSTSGTIIYEYQGNTEGIRRFYFRGNGEEMALYSSVSRNSTFYGVVSTSDENSIEIFKEGRTLHFDLDRKNAHDLEGSVNPLFRYLDIDPDSASLEKSLSELGAQYIGQEKIGELNCAHYKFRNNEFWISGHILVKFVSFGFNKNFSMEIVEIDLDTKVEDHLFSYPENIAIPEKNY